MIADLSWQWPKRQDSGLAMVSLHLSTPTARTGGGGGGGEYSTTEHLTAHNTAVLPLANSPGGHRLGVNGLAVDCDQSIL
jgi:hypothetical protein